MKNSGLFHHGIHQGRLLFLDGLRGIAAIGVILFHFYSLLALHLEIPLPGYIDALFFSGHYGVQIFFVLSGFVIAYSTRNAQFDRDFLKDFIIRRSIRLDPPYWVVIFALIFLSVAGSLIFSKDSLSPLSFSEIIANLFYVQYLSGVPSILPVAWTLCIELQLYLALMLLLMLGSWFIKKFHLSPLFESRLFVSLFGLFALFCLLCKIHVITLFEAFGNTLFIHFWHQFFLGSLVCWTIYKGVSEKWLFAFFMLMGICLVFNFNEEDLAAVVTAGIIFYIAKKERMYSLLTSPFLQWAGRISYSLYITHWLTGMKFIDVFKERILIGKIGLTTGCLLYVVAVSITFAAAHLFYRWVEEPSLRLSRNWSRLKLLAFLRT